MNRQIGTTLFASLLAILVLVGCVQSTAAPGRSTDDAAKNADGYTDITVEQLVQMMEDGDPMLVNTHIPFAGDLPDTDLSIPFDQIDQYLDRLPDKDAPIVLYCRSGSMSTSAAKELAALGYTDVYELDGGMNAWTDAGYELVGS
jgi:rhodanese-related sulfurtransferase